jgi:phosphate transport system permease protein
MSAAAAVNQRTLPPGKARSYMRRFRAGDELAYLITIVAAGAIFIITALVFYELLAESSLSRHKFG